MKKSDVLLKGLGLDAETFVSMALAQLVIRRGIPFAVTESDESYFASEYGLSSAQADEAGAAMNRIASRARRAGKLREVTKRADLAS